MRLTTYKCSKCEKEIDQPANAIAVEHACPKASDYDKRTYGGMVPLHPKVSVS